MKYADFKDSSAVELKKKKAVAVHELFEAKLKNQLGQLSNPLEIRKLRRNVARINTALVLKIAR